MPNLFRIETDQTELTWSDKPRPETVPSTGRLAITWLNQASKNIHIQRHGLADDIANNRDVAVGPCLYEEIAYDFLLQSKAQGQIEIRHRDPTILQGLHVSSNGIIHGTIKFRGQIGRSPFSVYVDGKAEYDFEVEVFPSKLDYAADYDVLVADIQEILTGLVLEYLRSTFRLGFAAETEESSQLEWLLLLRHVVDDLERGLRYIERHPHYGLRRERVATRVEKLRRPGATIAKLIAQGKGQGRRSRTASGRVLHARLPERRARITSDTPEHRWLASQLNSIRRSLAEIHSAERKSRSQNRHRHLSTLEEIANLENRIEMLQSLAPIAQARGSVPAGFSSLTLQTGPGYGKAYRACLILLQGLRVDGGPVGLSVKEIHYLYEYWCYLSLVRLVAKITGEHVPVRELFSIDKSGLRVRLRRGTCQRVNFSNRSIELTYNPHYKGDAFILPQRPDVVLTFRYPHWPAMRLVFDAKYRIRTDANYVKQLGSPGPPEDAINSLHRYRDAILEETGSDGPRSEKFKHSVVEGVALFPYADVSDQFRSSYFWKKLESIGIGAIPFLPRETRYLEEWLREALERGGWSTAERAIPYLSLEQLRAWQQAEKELTLIAVLKPNQDLESIGLTRRYYTPLVADGRRQFLARWVAFYLPAAAITHRAAVENIELQKDQFVYELGEVQKLEKRLEDPHQNEFSKRFSKNCWTSRLGLEMARELREVFLATTAEWRLYEQLRIARVDFTVTPDSGGSSWFVTKRGRVQYQKAAGFLIRRKGMRDEFRSHPTEVVERLASQT